MKLTNLNVKVRWIALATIVLLSALLVLIPFLKNEQTYEESARPYFQHNGEISIPESSPIRDKIKTEQVQTEILSRQISGPASVEANPLKMANIFPPVNGRVMRLYVNIGDHIRKGQALFEIYSSEIAEVQTEYISARSSMAQAERELRRKEDLHDKRISPQRELEEARTQFEIAKSELEGASLKLQILGLSEDEIGKPLVVRSPINGRLVDMTVSQGEFISDAEKPLMVIADLSSIWVTSNIQEKDIRFISTGLQVSARFPAYPDEVYNGQVLFVSDILNTETRTTKAIIQFDNPDIKLKPGMFASVVFHTTPAEMVVISPESVLQRRDYNYVYVETTPYHFEKRIISVGENIEGKLVIPDGLKTGESIVTVNAVLLP